MDCPFCDHTNILQETETMYIVLDEYPVSKGHMLAIPKRHVTSYFELTDREMFEMRQLLKWGKNRLDKRQAFSPDGYNIGINLGKVAGQTIKHLHVHLIPRYKGDVDDPTGGVRGVIPDKRVY